MKINNNNNNSYGVHLVKLNPLVATSVDDSFFSFIHILLNTVAEDCSKKSANTNQAIFPNLSNQIKKKKMTSIVRIKRRPSQEPAEALLLAAKRLKVEESDSSNVPVVENVFRFCGTIENEVIFLI